jgi:long-chain acyl-CoA synthetase
VQLTNEQTLRELLTAKARRFERNTFLEFYADNYTYGAVDDRTDRVATVLSRLGLRFGDRVILLLSNRPELVFFLLGAPKIGVIPVPLDPVSTREEILSSIRHSGAVAVVTEKAYAVPRDLTPDVRQWIVVDDESFAQPPFLNLSSGTVLRFWPDLSPEDAAVILYPRDGKPVVLTHRNLISTSAQTLLPFRINESDRFLCALPLSSITAQLLLLLAPWSAGATCVLREAFSAGIVGDIEACGATVLAGTPRFYKMIADADGFATTDLSSLRLAFCAGGLVDRETAARFEQRHDALIVEGYGPLEAGGICCANPYTGVRKPGSIGLPLPGQECRIVGPDGRESPVGVIGEIVVRGSNVMKGYFRHPEASLKALRDGWLHTGDTACTDSDGYYYLKDNPAERN